MDIPCGNDADPYYIAVSRSKDYAYIADYSNNAVLQLDLNRSVIVNRATVLGRPRGLDVSPNGHLVYVVFDYEPVMQILQAGSLQEVTRITLPSHSGSVAVTEDGTTAYVTQPELNQTVVINLCTNLVISQLNTGISPGRMARSDKDALLLVAGRESQTLTAIDTCGASVIDYFSIQSTPSGLDFTKNSQICLVALPLQNEAAFVDFFNRQVITRVPVGPLPGGVAASKLHPLAVVCNQQSSTVSILDTNSMTVTATVQVGADPAGVAVID